MLSLPKTDGCDFSLQPELLRDIFKHARPLGHNEDAGSLNLGFGFLYYGLVRTLRPRHVLVIGSGFGFSVVCLALGLKDNGDGGRLSFVDPSYSVLKHGPLHTIGGTAQWDDPQKVQARFARFGVENQVTHHKLMSAEFFATEAKRLPSIDLAFIDGSHAYADVRRDFLSTLHHTHRNSYLWLHDTNIYVRELVRHAGVKRWLKVIAKEKEHFELIDFPFSSGVALVRVLHDGAWEHAE
jgi:hypothetical protein